VIGAAQAQAAKLLGVEWPPDDVLWNGWELARRPDAPRISKHRKFLLEWRIEALEMLRLAAFGARVPAASLARAHQVVRATQQAVRRPARDPRTQPKPRRRAPQSSLEWWKSLWT
jgi:hypothetical protein